MNKELYRLYRVVRVANPHIKASRAIAFARNWMHAFKTTSHIKVVY